MADDDDTRNADPVPTDAAEIVSRVLDEHDVDAEHALLVLVKTLVLRHVDCELRKMGRRDAWTPGNERLNALTAAFDALYENIHRHEGFRFAGPNQPHEKAGDAEGLEGADERTAVRRALAHMLTECQFLAE